jgi:hypothetical protein
MKKLYAISSRNGSYCIGYGIIWHIFKRKNIYNVQCTVTISHYKLTADYKKLIQDGTLTLCIKKSEILEDYLSRNVVEAIRMSNKDLDEKQNTDPLFSKVKHILRKEPIKQT